MARGGARTGTPGKAYGARTDLNTNRVQAPAAATGQPYGQAGAQLASQKVVPVAAPPAPMPAAPTAAPPAPASPGSGPGEMPGLADPTARPDEHVMHGAASGPGAGPEMFAAPNPLLSGLAILNQLPHLPPELAHISAQLQAQQANAGAA